MEGKDIINYHRHGGLRRRSSNGTEQVAISAKIDRALMEELEKEQSASGVKRNALLNMALWWYLSQLDEARREAATYAEEEKYILKIDTARMTGGEAEKLQHIARSFGAEPSAIATEMVRQGLRDYDGKPFAFMP